MKRLILVCMVLAIILVTLILFNQNKNVRIPAPQAHVQAVTKQEAKLLAPARSDQNDQTAKDPIMRTSAAVWKKSSIEDPRDLAAEVLFREDAPFRCLGGSGTGRVVDREGKVLMESEKEIGILDVAVGPDKQQVLVKGGDAVSYVLKPSANVEIKLPAFPPVSNMLGLGWHWIDDTNLLGSGGTNALDENGKPVRNDNNVGQSKLYIFNLESRDLAELLLPPEVKQTVLEIPEVGLGGYFHLIEHSTDGRNEKDLGWFKLDAER